MRLILSCEFLMWFKFNEIKYAHNGQSQKKFKSLQFGTLSLNSSSDGKTTNKYFKQIYAKSRI